jgi:2-polyprenyl-3-methyl-5-hydroxy-6-metoxy-1,4-benzoquinol methylase
MMENGKVPRTAPLENCPVCGDKNTKHFFTTTDRLHGISGKFSYHICANCSTVFQNPMVIQEDLHLCYPQNYTPYNYKKELPDIDFDSFSADGFPDQVRKAIIQSVKNQKPTGIAGKIGNLLSKSRYLRERAFYGLVTDELLPKEREKSFALDLGCGAGWLMQRLKKVGWDVEGVEWNEEAARFAADLTNLKVWAGDFREIDLPKKRYQLIVLNHVFEHISEPKTVLERAYELLADDGKLILYYPNPDSLGASWLGADWFPWEAPRHLIFPPPKALKLIAENSGFQSVTIFTRNTFSKSQWIKSKAYKLGLHPENETPELGLSEKIGFLTEFALAKMGQNKGWEITAILKKG